MAYDIWEDGYLNIHDKTKLIDSNIELGMSIAAEKSEARNPKYKTNSNDQNTNDSNKNPGSQNFLDSIFFQTISASCIFFRD